MNFVWDGVRYFIIAIWATVGAMGLFKLMFDKKKEKVVRRNLPYQRKNKMSLFEKARKFTIADEAKEQGIYPYFHQLTTKQDVVVNMEGREVMMFGSK